MNDNMPVVVEIVKHSYRMLMGMLHVQKRKKKIRKLKTEIERERELVA